MALGNNPTQLEVVKAIKDLENKPSDDTWRAIYVNGVKYKSNSISGGDLDFRNGDNVTAKIGAKGVTLGVASGYSIPSTTKQSEWTNKQDALDAQTAYTAKGTSTKVPTITTNALGQVTAITETNIAFPVTSVNGKTGAVTGLATSNPNLLINSNFAINQRDGYFAPVGATVYADDLTTVLGTVRTAVQTNIYNSTWRVATSIAATLNGSNITISTGYIKKSDCTYGYVEPNNSTIYTVDRWRILNGKVVPTNTGVTVTPLTTACQFTQLLELDISNKLDGKTLTLSCSCNGTTYSASGTLVRNRNTSLCSITLPNNAGLIRLRNTANTASLYVQGLLNNSNLTYCNFEWVKLEVGDVATEYTPPLIAEELTKCQRYYQIVRTKGGSANIFGFGALRSARNVLIEIPTVSTLRVAPTVSIYNIALLNLQTGRIVQSGTTITLLSISNNNVFLQIATTSDIGTTGANVQLYGLSAESYIAFDAEL